MSNVKFDTCITVEDEDGEEFDIEVEIEYHISNAEPDVNYPGGIEEYRFTKSDSKEFTVWALNRKLDNDQHFKDYIYTVIIEDTENVDCE